MRVKKFQAGDIRTALKKVRDELGPDAVILHTRTTTPGGLFGFLRGKIIEVTAATDVTPQKAVPVEPPSTPSTLSVLSASPALPKPQALPAEAPSISAPPSASSILSTLPPPPTTPRIDRVDASTTVPVHDLRLSNLEREISLLKSSIDTLLERESAAIRRDVEADLKPYYDPLIASEVQPDLARRMAEMLAKSHEEDCDPRDRLADEVARRILIADPITVNPEERKVIVLVGPTGVGKTTTLAKIAAGFLREELKIAFLTADTYRIAAVEQLQKYAEIMGLPMEAVYTPGELREALDRHTDSDLVFVDTAGRSPHNRSQMAEMAAIVEACLPAEVHLVLSVNIKHRDLVDASQLFSVAPINRLIFTKMDESVSYGSILNIADEFQLPVSYVTNGQNVPEDIEAADARRLAQFVIYGKPVEVSE